MESAGRHANVYVCERRNPRFGMPELVARVRGRPATIRDVAERAAVHPSVVSRVMSLDANLRVRDETRARVLQAIEELGYVPNSVARGLRVAQNGSVALIVPNVANPAYAPIVAGAQRRAMEAGLALVLGTVNRERQGDLSDFGHLLHRGRVDGLLIAVARLSDPELVLLEEARLPVILVNRRSKLGLPYVVADEHKGAVLGTKHLLELGHQRILHMAGDLGVDTWARRKDGFLAAMADAGVGPRKRAAMVRPGGITEAEGYDAACRVLSADIRPTALFFGDTRAALGGLAAAHDLGVAVPSDVSFMGFPDNPFAAFSVPRLTVVHVPLEEMGYVGMSLLAQLIAGERVRPEVLAEPPIVIERESTGPPPA